MSHDVAMLEALLKKARAEAAEAAKETPHTRLLADLADDRMHPREIAGAFGLIFQGFELLGVDLLAEGGPARVAKAKATRPASTDTPPATGNDTGAPAPEKE